MPDGLPPAAPPRPPRTGEAAPHKGRGAVSNPDNRFEGIARCAFDDGWDHQDDEAAPALATTLTRDSSRSVIAWNQSPDIGFDRAVNPYRGCEHGCIYCYARPSHAYLGLSPGLDFETKISFKPEAAALLEKELRKPGYVARPMALGSNTDPYQPVERTLKLTRQVLEVLDAFNHPVTIVTKSSLVLRDLDILSRMAARKLARVAVSVTTLDRNLARVMEPRAATPMRRVQAIGELVRAGVPASVLAAPMVPGLNDAELERILEVSAEAGASGAGYILLRLPHELRAMFTEWLEAHFPGRAAHVLSLIRQTRAGALNDARFGYRFGGVGPYADLLAARFARAARKLGLEGPREGLDCTQFRAPPAASPAGFAEKQMALAF
jgi:DNA repair photolyase